LLSLLKLDADKLGEELKAGKSLAAVAEAQGVSVDDLVSLLVEQNERKRSRSRAKNGGRQLHKRGIPRTRREKGRTGQSGRTIVRKRTHKRAGESSRLLFSVAEQSANNTGIGRS
ncbi:hypothetical protein ABES04_04075, partial [Brevibacillus parabrevis]